MYFSQGISRLQTGDWGLASLAFIFDSYFAKLSLCCSDPDHLLSFVLPGQYYILDMSVLVQP